MGAIVDAGVADEVFGSNRSEAGKHFFDWIDAGKGNSIPTLIRFIQYSLRA